MLLFAVSTAIAWSYYGDRCANYLFGHGAVLPYKIVFVVMHFLGAVAPLGIAWSLGDIALALVHASVSPCCPTRMSSRSPAAREKVPRMHAPRPGKEVPRLVD